MKTVADNNYDIAQMMKLVSDSEENSVGKGGNAGYLQFIFFPSNNVFEKP